MKKIIGLTGTYCAGKNYIAAFLEKRGLPVLDVDKLGHKVLETEQTAVFARFGDDLKKADGTVDRHLLGKKVFGKPAEMTALQEIVHPAVNRLTAEWIAGRKGSCVVNAALIHKSIVFEQLDCIILVRASLLARLVRARFRDGLSLPNLLHRFFSQKDFIPQYLSGKADIYNVENSGFPRRSGKKSTERRLNPYLERRIDEILSTEGIR